MRRRFAHALVISCILCLIGLPAHGGYTIADIVIAAAGGETGNGSLVLGFTVGETAVGSGSAGQTSVDCGFWEGVPIGYVGVGGEGAGSQGPGATGLPVEFALRPTAPNPFTIGAMISYAIPKGQEVPVFVGIYDVRGALVRTLVHETRVAGSYSVAWDARSDSGVRPGPGVYFTKLRAGSFQRIQKIVMLK